MSDKFILQANYQPQGDQPQAIERILSGFKNNHQSQVLLGVTGSGKTFTMAKVIEALNKPTLVISHNKTLAAQLYGEFKEYFPQNAVNYFVSYYDYYQPEAYLPRTDTYIEKDSSINDEIDRLRNAATSALLSRKDALIVASVSCIYGLGDPEDYQALSLSLVKGEIRKRDKVLRRLVDIQYQRNDRSLERGFFRVRGDLVDIFPSYEETAIRLEFLADKIEKIKQINHLTGEIIKELDSYTVFPAKHFVTTKERIVQAAKKIEEELEERVKYFQRAGKPLEAERIYQRTKFDLEMLMEVGYCSGIENYSRYLSNRGPGEQTATLLDYFPDDYLLLIDESHMTIPQIGGMYRGDRSRKETLVEYGFRLPSALDNRPLTFSEFEKHLGETLFVSATPVEYELNRATNGQVKSVSQYYQNKERNIEGIVEQIIRPTGLLDPQVEVRKTENQIDDLIAEIRKTIEDGERVLITTLTKRMAEELSSYLKEMKIKVKYIHSEINTLDRPELLRELRLGLVDCLVGINLLREGIDLPEVSLVAILDADKEGFLRSEQALTQTIGRAARHVNGRVIMYADQITGSMERAIESTKRRRELQQEYNRKEGITPKSIKKEIKNHLSYLTKPERETFDLTKLPRDEIDHLTKELEKKMKFAAANLDFEQAAEIRDRLTEIRDELARATALKKITKN